MKAARLWSPVVLAVVTAALGVAACGKPTTTPDSLACPALVFELERGLTVASGRVPATRSTRSFARKLLARLYTQRFVASFDADQVADARVVVSAATEAAAGRDLSDRDLRQAVRSFAALRARPPGSCPDLSPTPRGTS